MDLLPSIDLRQGRVVRLRRGDDAQRTVYDLDPWQVLRSYAAAGVGRVHVVDLDAALGEPPQRALLAALIARQGAPRVQLGGGLRDRGAVEWAFETGCDRVVITSLLARDFDLFAALTHDFPQRLVPALDVAEGEVRTDGWTAAAPFSLQELCRRLRPLPIPVVLVTDVQRDGTMNGPNIELVRTVSRAAGVPGLLSGGVQALSDLEAARQVPEIAAVIVGRALYDGAFSLQEALAACAGEESRGE
jgi:phosphoribosylformimino-5-aminoimidazole carboxamide ribotide isomerase